MSEVFQMDASRLGANKKLLEQMLINAESEGSRSLEGGQKALYNSIRSYLKWAETEIRRQMIKVYAANLPNDPRRARLSVSRNNIHSKGGQIWGGVKILQPKTAGAVKSRYVPPRKLDANPHQRGGNRRKLGNRTQSIMSYGARDRGFILRFLENGTVSRQTRFGNRGSLHPRPIWSRTSPYVVDEVLKKVADKIQKRINDLIEKDKL